MFRLNLPLQRTFLMPPLALTLVLSLVMLLPATLQQWFFLVREDAHFHALFTSQLIHHSWGHLALNLGGIWLWWALFAESVPRLRYWFALPMIMLLSSSAELLFNSNFTLYAGFSGTLYGLYAYSGAVELCQKKLIGSLVLLGVVVKLIVDFSGATQAVGLALFAHLGGVVAGLFLAIFWSIYGRNNASK